MDDDFINMIGGGSDFILIYITCFLVISIDNITYLNLTNRLVTFRHGNNCVCRETIKTTCSHVKIRRAHIIGSNMWLISVMRRIRFGSSLFHEHDSNPIAYSKRNQVADERFGEAIPMNTHVPRNACCQTNKRFRQNETCCLAQCAISSVKTVTTLIYFPCALKYLP